MSHFLVRVCVKPYDTYEVCGNKRAENKITTTVMVEHICNLFGAFGFKIG